MCEALSASDVVAAGDSKVVRATRSQHLGTVCCHETSQQLEEGS